MYSRTAVAKTACFLIAIIACLGSAVHASRAQVNSAVVRTGAKRENSQAPLAQRAGIGPDIIVAQVGLDPGTALGSFANYPAANGWQPYAVNSTACNIGDAPASWRDGTTANPDARHPVIAQNMYRLKAGRFEQIGLSWLKHGFCAFAQNQCGTCNHATDCDWLFVGCSDAYSAGQNGNFQDKLCPRHEVNPVTGLFPFPSAVVQPIADTTSRRLRARLENVQAATNPDASYYIEVQYISQDDAAAGNALNNVSHRRFTLDADGLITGAPNPTVQQTPAIYAWKAAHPSVQITPIDIAGDGRLYLAWNVTNNNDGTWTYEYALYNMTSDRAVGGFRVPKPLTLRLCDIGFHDVEYDAGEPYDGTDWAVTTTGPWCNWSTEDYSSNANANAIRWSSLYNFRFTANAPPETADVEIHLFKPGSPTTVLVTSSAPGTAGIVCPQDCDPQCGDGEVSIADIIRAIVDFGGPTSPCDISPAGGDGIVSIGDIVDIIAAFGPCNM